MKIERTRIHFFSDVSLPSPSSDLKVPTTTAKATKTSLKKFSAIIPTRSLSLMKANFPGVELSRKIFRFKKRKRNSSSYVHVFDIT